MSRNFTSDIRAAIAT